MTQWRTKITNLDWVFTLVNRGKLLNDSTCEEWNKGTNIRLRFFTLRFLLLSWENVKIFTSTNNEENTPYPPLESLSFPCISTRKIIINSHLRHITNL